MPDHTVNTEFREAGSRRLMQGRLAWIGLPAGGGSAPAAPDAATLIPAPCA